MQLYAILSYAAVLKKNQKILSSEHLEWYISESNQQQFMLWCNIKFHAMPSNSFGFCSATKFVPHSDRHIFLKIVKLCSEHPKNENLSKIEGQKLSWFQYFLHIQNIKESKKGKDLD